MESIWEDLKYERSLSRNEFPVLLDEMVERGLLDDLDELAIALEDAWTMADLPLLALGRQRWIELFRRVGYLSDTVRRESLRPRIPLTLYRAAAAYDRVKPGLAWSQDIEQARSFQEYNLRHIRGPLFLFSAQVEPSEMLAYFHQTRAENEFLVDIPRERVHQLDE